MGTLLAMALGFVIAKFGWIVIGLLQIGWWWLFDHRRFDLARQRLGDEYNPVRREIRLEFALIAARSRLMTIRDLPQTNEIVARLCDRAVADASKAMER